MLARDEDDYIREEISLKCIQQIQVADNNDDPSSRPKASQENVLDMLDDGRLPSLKEDIGVVENERDSNRMKRVVSFNGLLTNGQNKACWHHFDVLFRVDALETTIRFSLRSASKSDLEKMIRILKKARARFIDHMPGASMIKRIRRRLHEFYDKYTSWGIMASLLVANFIVDIGQAEIQPEPGSQDERLFHAIDTAFTVLYVVDLFINLCAHSPRAFFRKGWNILDLGRKIEQVLYIISLLKNTFQNRQNAETDHDLLEAILESTQSLITYRYTYQDHLQLPLVLELLILDMNYPKSLAYLVHKIKRYVSLLPKANKDQPMSEQERLMLEAYTSLKLAKGVSLARHENNGQYEALADFLDKLYALIAETSVLVSKTYFRHTVSQKQLFISNLL